MKGAEACAFLLTDDLMGEFCLSSSGAIAWLHDTDCWRISEGRRENINSSYSPGHQQHHIYKQLDPGNWLFVKSVLQTILGKLAVAAALQNSSEKHFISEKVAQVDVNCSEISEKKENQHGFLHAVPWEFRQC